MDQLAPHHVPVYEKSESRQRLWDQCAQRGQPVVAIRDARRGYIVRYDIQHLDAELRPDAVQDIRERTRRWRSSPARTDPSTETVAVGDEGDPDSGLEDGAADSGSESDEVGDEGDSSSEPAAVGDEVDSVSESEGVGGEAGTVSGDLHADTEAEARELASRLSAIVFDRENWL